MREPGIRAPEMGEMACKQARLAGAIAAQTRLGHSFLRNTASLMRSMPTFSTAC